MADCKACGAWFSSTAPDELCPTCKRALKRLNGYAVPVVRCKDCKHWKKGEFKGGDTKVNLEWGGGCPLARFARYESDFCSYGERKDNERKAD